MQRSVRSGSEVGDGQVGAFQSEILGSHLSQVGVGVLPEHRVGDVSTELLQERQFVRVLVARDDLEDEHAFLQFLFWRENNTRTKRKNHAVQLHIKKNFTNVMQQKQKRGHHFVFTTDHSKIYNNKNFIRSIKNDLANMRKQLY